MSQSITQRLPFAGLTMVWFGFALPLQNPGGDCFWIYEILTMPNASGGVDAILNARDHIPQMNVATFFSGHFLATGSLAVEAYAA